MILHYDPVLLFQMVTCCYQQLYYVQPLNKLNHSQALAIKKEKIYYEDIPDYHSITIY